MPSPPLSPNHTTATQRPGERDAADHVQRGDSLQQASQYEQALVEYFRASELQPDDMGPCLREGRMLIQLHRTDQARQRYMQFLSRHPQSNEVRFALAELMRKQGQLTSARSEYQHILQQMPDHLQAGFLLACVELQLGRLHRAIEGFQHTLKLDPHHAAAWNNLGHAWHVSGRLEDARQAYEKATQWDDSLVDAHQNLGALHHDQRRFDKAAACLGRAVELDPARAHAHYRLGLSLGFDGREDEAQQAYQAALALRPENLLWRARIETLGQAIFATQDEIRAYRRRLGHSLGQLSRREESIDLADVTTSCCRPPFCLAYQHGNPRPLKEQFAAVFRGRFPKPHHRKSTGKPHVGFVVTAGHEGVFLRCMGGILNRFHSESLRYTVTASARKIEGMRRVVANRRIEFMPLPEEFVGARETLEAAAFDLLYYWEVGTDSTNYFLPLCRPAPRQCTSWGWPVTSGMREIDWYVSSEDLEGADAEAHYTERLVRLSRLPCCTSRPEIPDMLPTRDDLGLPAQRRIYLCPQNLLKYDPGFDALIGGILRCDPQGEFLWIESTVPAVSRRLEQRWQHTLSDVLPRMRRLKRMPLPRFLGLVAAADVVLDTRPYGGGANTTYETLAVGTPLVTWPTTFHRGRFAAAALRQIGDIPGVAHSGEEYRELACRLAMDRDFRRDVSQQIRQRSNALFDDHTAATQLETFLREAVHEPPRPRD
jgi:predicted O-linked N-acetylglucosamine transferase (SPINDLY family)